MRTFRELVYFIRGEDAAPVSGVKAFRIGSDDDATLRTAFGKDDRAVGRQMHYIAPGQDAGPASGVKVAVFSSDESGTDIGKVHTDTWGNEINNQKWQGAVS